MISKKITFDNSEGKYKRLLISSITPFDFFKNLTTVRVYNLNAEDISGLMHVEYYSSRIIMESNQKQKNSFYIPRSNSKYRIEILITTDIDKEVDDIVVQQEE